MFDFFFVQIKLLNLIVTKLFILYNFFHVSYKSHIFENRLIGFHFINQVFIEHVVFVFWILN